MAHKIDQQKQLVSDRIFVLLKAKNLTQKKFSEMTGIPESTISDWKKKRLNPGADKIPVICSALGISPERLLGMEPDTTVPAAENSRAEYLSHDEQLILGVFRSLSDEKKKRLQSYVLAMEADSRGKNNSL